MGFYTLLIVAAVHQSALGQSGNLQGCVLFWFISCCSLCTTLSLQWEPEIIAVAVMYLAGRLCKFEIQEWTSKPMYRRWWEQFVQDVPVDVLEGMKTISHNISCYCVALVIIKCK